MAIGARAQSAKTYIDKFYLDGKTGFDNMSVDEVVKHVCFHYFIVLHIFFFV